MERNFDPPQEGESVIDSTDGKERARWMLTKYLRRPPVFIRAPYARFDDLMCDPEGWVWGVVLSSAPENPSVQIVRCADYLVGQDNLVVEQPLRLTI